MQPANKSTRTQRESVAHRVVVEPPSDQDPRLGIGQLGHQLRSQRRRAVGSESIGQPVLGKLAILTIRTFGGVRQGDESAGVVGAHVHSRRADNRGTTGQSRIECQPRLIRTHMQSIESVRRPVRPQSDDQDDGSDEPENEDCQSGEGHEPTTRTPVPPTVTVS